MDQQLLDTNLAFEQAVRFLAARVPVSTSISRKPVLAHDVRVGVYLYQHGYTKDIVVAGLLHDVLEWAGVGAEELRVAFGDRVLELVKANSKDDTIKDRQEKIHEIITRCATCGCDALVIKAADIIDSFAWYTLQQNSNELQYCIWNADEILRLVPETNEDLSFKALREWRGRCGM